MRLIEINGESEDNFGVFMDKETWMLENFSNELNDNPSETLRPVRFIKRLLECLAYSVRDKREFDHFVREGRPEEDHAILNKFDLNVVVFPRLDSTEDLKETQPNLKLPYILNGFKKEYQTFYKQKYEQAEGRHQGKRNLNWIYGHSTATVMYRASIQMGTKTIPSSNTFSLIMDTYQLSVLMKFREFDIQ